MRRFWTVLRCAIAGHVKWTPPDQDPDGYKFVFVDVYDEKERLTINRCSRCGRYYLTQQHIPGMQRPQAPPPTTHTWPARENTRTARRPQ